ncbi:MAG: hypothetical protein IPJ81_17725 [Chitinophagaceae bacterium]|nr:hypothetical protein [Chitinophagaceae bacterium]
MDKYYKPSGRFSPISIVFLIIICSIAIPILGFLYSYAIWYIPFIYINFIITGLLGYATALLISRTVIRPGKVGNNLMSLLFGFIGGLAG